MLQTTVNLFVDTASRLTLLRLPSIVFKKVEATKTPDPTNPTSPLSFTVALQATLPTTKAGPSKLMRPAFMTAPRKTHPAPRPITLSSTAEERPQTVPVRLRPATQSTKLATVAIKCAPKVLPQPPQAAAPAKPKPPPAIPVKLPETAKVPTPIKAPVIVRTPPEVGVIEKPATKDLDALSGSVKAPTTKEKTRTSKTPKVPKEPPKSGKGSDDPIQTKPAPEEPKPAPTVAEEPKPKPTPKKPRALGKKSAILDLAPPLDAVVPSAEEVADADDLFFFGGAPSPVQTQHEQTQTPGSTAQEVVPVMEGMVASQPKQKKRRLA